MYIYSLAAVPNPNIPKPREEKALVRHGREVFMASHRRPYSPAAATSPLPRSRCVKLLVGIAKFEDSQDAVEGIIEIGVRPQIDRVPFIAIEGVRDVAVDPQEAAGSSSVVRPRLHIECRDFVGAEKLCVGHQGADLPPIAVLARTIQPKRCGRLGGILEHTGDPSMPVVVAALSLVRAYFAELGSGIQRLIDRRAEENGWSLSQILYEQEAQGGGATVSQGQEAGRSTRRGIKLGWMRKRRSGRTVGHPPPLILCVHVDRDPYLMQVAQANSGSA